MNAEIIHGRKWTITTGGSRYNILVDYFHHRVQVNGVMRDLSVEDWKKCLERRGAKEVLTA